MKKLWRYVCYEGHPYWHEERWSVDEPRCNTEFERKSLVEVSEEDYMRLRDNFNNQENKNERE